MARYPSQLALADARHVNRLADALLIAASEYAVEERLSPGTILRALAIALGQMTGSIASEHQEPLRRVQERVLNQVRRIAALEFGRRSWALQ